MSLHEIKISSWEDLNNWLEKTAHHQHDYHARPGQFRGQSDKGWKLNSSLQRIVIGNDISEKKAHYYETQARNEFLSQAHLLSGIITHNPDTLPTAVLVDMQHFSCPTRLIDWSGSPYIALYFAIRENMEANGALYFWDYSTYSQNMSAISLSTDIPANEILTFEEFDFVQLVFPTRKNERIVRQQACFSISNNILKSHCDLIVEAGVKAQKPCGLYKFEIPSELKFEFLARLRTMNITANSLLPGLDGLGVSIQENLRLRKASKR